MKKAFRVSLKDSLLMYVFVEEMNRFFIYDGVKDRWRLSIHWDTRYNASEIVRVYQQSRCHNVEEINAEEFLCEFVFSSL